MTCLILFKLEQNNYWINPSFKHFIRALLPRWPFPESKMGHIKEQNKNEILTYSLQWLRHFIMLINFLMTYLILFKVNQRYGAKKIFRRYLCLGHVMMSLAYPMAYLILPKVDKIVEQLWSRFTAFHHAYSFRDNLLWFCPGKWFTGAQCYSIFLMMISANLSKCRAWVSPF